MSQAVLAAGVTRKRFPLGEQRETVLLTPSKEARQQFPFYNALIAAGYDTPVQQLKWKIYVRERCIRDLEFRHAIWQMCKHDVAFFAVTFCWIFEPRPPRPLPFSPWVDQVDLLAWMTECFPERSLGLSKTRGIGATWLCTIFFYHKWLFWPEAKMAVLTKDKTLLESDNDNSLIGKFVYVHEHMPVWVRMTEDRQPIMLRSIENHSITHRLVRSSIGGYVSTDTKLRSLRFTAIWADEFAFYGRDAQEWMTSAGGTTMCRFFISTWNCLGGDTLVLTDNGVKPIVRVKLADRLWDGEEWVHHKGLSYNGEQDTIHAYGAWLTPGHRVLTQKGWADAEENLEKLHVNPPPGWEKNRRISELGFDDPAMYKSGQSCLGVLRREGNPRMQAVVEVRELSYGHGGTPVWTNARSLKLERPLRATQLPMGYEETAVEQSSEQHIRVRDECFRDSRKGGSLAKYHSDTDSSGVYAGTIAATEQAGSTQSVYDLVGAGPRSRFSIVSPDGELTLVHNSFTDMFHHIMYSEQSSMLKIFSYWHNNYERWRGAYKIVNGRTILVDKEYKHTPDYLFGTPDIIPEGTLRSPWVDAELLEPGAEGGVYQSLRDIYGMEVCSEDSSFFSKPVRDALDQSIQEPDRKGKIDVTKAEFELLPTNKSEVRIWGEPSYDKHGPFVAGFDLAFGSGASYSVMQVLDNAGRHILEYGTNDTDIKNFTINSVKIARWLCKGEDGVLFDFEANGNQARDFYEELERLRYGNIHSSEKKGVAKLRGVFNQRYNGTWNSDGNHANFTELARAILAMEIVVKSESIQAEIKLYGLDDKGRPDFPRMSKLGHGDFTAALGIAWNRAKNRVSVENRDERQGDPSWFSEPWLQSRAVFSHETRQRWSSNRR